jgi:hypothetical protein
MPWLELCLRLPYDACLDKGRLYRVLQLVSTRGFYLEGRFGCCRWFWCVCGCLASLLVEAGGLYVPFYRPMEAFDANTLTGSRNFYDLAILMAVMLYWMFSWLQVETSSKNSLSFSKLAVVLWSPLPRKCPIISTVKFSLVLTYTNLSCLLSLLIYLLTFPSASSSYKFFLVVWKYFFSIFFSFYLIFSNSICDFWFY